MEETAEQIENPGTSQRKRRDRADRAHSGQAAAQAGVVRPRRHLLDPRQRAGLPRWFRDRRPALRDSHASRPYRRPALYSRIGCEPDARRRRGRDADSSHGDAYRRPGAGAIRVPSFGQLPIGRDSWRGGLWSPTRLEKFAVMKGLIDHVAPGRWDHIRHPNDKELAAQRRFCRFQSWRRRRRSGSAIRSTTRPTTRCQSGVDRFLLRRER